MNSLLHGPPGYAPQVFSLNGRQTHNSTLLRRFNDPDRVIEFAMGMDERTPRGPSTKRHQAYQALIGTRCAIGCHRGFETELFKIKSISHEAIPLSGSAREVHRVPSTFDAV